MTSRRSRALRESSDAILRDARRLAELEERKRLLSGGDGGRVGLSEEIEALSRRLLAETATETALTSHIAAVEGDAAPPIAATRREISTILAEWRAAEREAAEAAPRSPEQAAAQLRAAQLAEEHRSALREEMRQG